MGQAGNQQPAKPDPKKARKPWKKPQIHRVKLTEDEVAALRSAENPQAMLRELWPALKARKL